VRPEGRYGSVLPFGRLMTVVFFLTVHLDDVREKQSVDAALEQAAEQMGRRRRRDGRA
jgi:TRAP-type C4-dicarboxylate transport system permease small subunit